MRMKNSKMPKLIREKIVIFMMIFLLAGSLLGTYLRANCRYADSWRYNNANSAWGALVYGEAQCSGYARAMKALCDGIGVKCYYVHANGKADNPSHQWNEVRVGGKWYIVDAQSGFFLVGSKTWRNKAGMRWNTKGLPKCSTTDHKKAILYGNLF